jgi:hypothetical protein
MSKKISVLILGLAVGLFIAGCTTYQTAWDNRVGVYTYDQAVAELGPPDKQAKLTDGQTVADWVSRYSSGPTIGAGGGFYSGSAAFGAMQTTPIYRESTLRLTFSTNHVLTAWSKD